MGTEEITMFRTSDGEIHDSKQKADEYVKEKILGTMSNIVKPVILSDGYAKTEIPIVEVLYSNRDFLYKILSLEN